MVHNSVMKRTLQFLQHEGGQDLIEYSLLITFIALGSLAILLAVGQSPAPIWNNAGTQLNAAAAVASS